MPPSKFTDQFVKAYTGHLAQHGLEVVPRHHGFSGPRRSRCPKLIQGGRETGLKPESEGEQRIRPGQMGYTLFVAGGEIIQSREDYRHDVAQFHLLRRIHLRQLNRRLNRNEAMTQVHQIGKDTSDCTPTFSTAAEKFIGLGYSPPEDYPRKCAQIRHHFVRWSLPASAGVRSREGVPTAWYAGPANGHAQRLG